jgi:phosphoenolpyruvate carboxykinase (GTP)
MNTSNRELEAWVKEVAQLTTPDQIYWCDGSDEEYERLVHEMLESHQLIELNKETFPRCYLHRSDPSDVARTEHLTFVCTPEKEDAGPNNNWLPPEQAHERIDKLFAGVMKGRTMYVIPYCMGPLTSPYARYGVEITDSPYVVANMKIMTRMGRAALNLIEKGGPFVKGLHSTGDLREENRLIVHFPEELLIKSIGSGYGGNALLGKKCHSLRLGSYQARQEGWLAEHMLIVGIENPQGETFYIAAAFPSSCGKTNLAMLIPPESYKGWKVWTVGDDIAWIHLGEDGYMYAINPEAGYFGVAPGTSPKTNPNAVATLKHDAIFTNVALTENNEPWWEGLDNRKPAIDWQGRVFHEGQGPAAQANSRFTVSAKQCPSYSPQAENPRGVRLSAIVFGGRRPSLVPLVYQAKNWEHGVLIGATMASQTTAAATGQVGVLRRDPMAMKPFCGYNFADYWTHWLSFAQKSDKLPKIFHVNWFRQDSEGKFIWPGYGENMRVIRWILDRANHRCDAIETPLGYIPQMEDLDSKGLPIDQATLKTLCAVHNADWIQEWKDVGHYLDTFGARMPTALKRRQKDIETELLNTELYTH